MPSTIYMQDVERQVDPQESKDMPDLRERAGQGCFLCLESHNQGQYAILVPCRRPTKASRIIGCTRNWDCTGDPKPIYEETMPWDSACESDDEIYQRLIDTCYQHLGWWKRWLPYFGITEVLEVNFQFAGFVEPDGRCPIRMNPIDLKTVSEECERIIARHPTDPYFDLNDACLNDSQHSEQCLIGMQEWSQPCIKVEAEEAEQRRKRLLFLSHLKECARNPARANGLYTLEGLAQESCIYDIKGSSQVVLPLPYQKFQGTAWMRGIHFILGWQTDRMHIELPFRVSCAWFGIASIWLSLVLWRGVGGDWGTAFAFAQVVAASVAIIVTYVRS